MLDLNTAPEAEVKKTKKEKVLPKLFYKPFEYVPAALGFFKDKKGRKQVRIIEYAYYKRNRKAGEVIASGGREYVVQKSGALVRKDKKPSKRDIHRGNV